MMAFAAYWWWRSFEFAVGLVTGIWRLHVARRRDWLAAASDLAATRRLHHLLLVPTYRESEDLLAETLDCLANQTVPARATRGRARLRRTRSARARPGGQSDASASSACSATGWSRFIRIWPGEVKGKSSNLAWAAQRAEAELIDTGQLDPQHLLVTVLDADSRLDRQYLAALGHDALAHPDGMLHVYQPAILFYANHRRLPPLLGAVEQRVLAVLAGAPGGQPPTGAAVDVLAELVGGARASSSGTSTSCPKTRTCSSRSGCTWDAACARAPSTCPCMPTPPKARPRWRTVTSTYQQIRRWAWGVSDIPYLALRTLRARHIPWHMRFARVGWYVEEHLVWPSHWFLLTLGGLVPPLINPEYAATALASGRTARLDHLLGLCLPAVLLAILADVLLKQQLPGRSGT